MNRNFRSHSNSYINSYIASRLFSCFFLLLLQQVQNDSTIDSAINYTIICILCFAKKQFVICLSFCRMHVCLTILNRHVFQSGSYTRTCHKKMCHTYEESSFRQIYTAFLWKISSIQNINTGL